MTVVTFDRRRAYDVAAQFRTARKHTVIADLVNARWWNQGSEPRNEFRAVEHQMRRAVGPRTFQT